MARIAKMGSVVVVIAVAFAFTFWLRGDLNTDQMISDVLIKNVPVAYSDADGESVSTEYDSTLYDFPHLVMSGGELTLNNQCPVRKGGLNVRVQTLFVNGKPIGFC